MLKLAPAVAISPSLPPDVPDRPQRSPESGENSPARLPRAHTPLHRLSASRLALPVTPRCARFTRCEHGTARRFEGRRLALFDGYTAPAVRFHRQLDCKVVSIGGITHPIPALKSLDLLGFSALSMPSPRARHSNPFATRTGLNAKAGRATAT